jgi:hypothetical protein
VAGIIKIDPAPPIMVSKGLGMIPSSLLKISHSDQISPFFLLSCIGSTGNED